MGLDGGRRGARETSPQFTPEYEHRQHYIRLEAMRPALQRQPTPVKQQQQRLALRAVKRIEVIHMADLPRYHYEVWADFDDGGSELLQRDYVRGLKHAVRMAAEKWGGGHRMELCRWRPTKRLPNMVIGGGA